MTKLSSTSKFYLTQVPKAVLACLASLPIAIISFSVVYLCCGTDLYTFDKFHSDVISNLTLSSILTQKIFKEHSKWLHQFNYPTKYVIISLIVVLIGCLCFGIEAFFILRYFAGNMKIIAYHSYWFTFVVMASLFFFDHQIVHDQYIVKIMFWYLISWIFYYIVNEDAPLAAVRTAIYIFFLRHHILKFLPTERLNQTTRLFIFVILMVIHTMVFEELAMLTANDSSIVSSRAVHYQSHLTYGFTIANNYLLKPLQDKVMKKQKFLPLYILASYGWGILLGSIAFTLYHLVFFPYFFSIVISNTYPRTDSLFVAGSLSWVDRVCFVQTLIFDVATKHHPPPELMIAGLQQKSLDSEDQADEDVETETLETFQTDPINDCEFESKF